MAQLYQPCSWRQLGVLGKPEGIEKRLYRQSSLEPGMERSAGKGDGAGQGVHCQDCQRGFGWKSAPPPARGGAAIAESKALLEGSWWGCNWYVFLESYLAASSESLKHVPDLPF